MNDFIKRCLRYVKNAGEGATADRFIEDHAPIGERLYLELIVGGWIKEDETNHIYLTESGKEALAQ